MGVGTGGRRWRAESTRPGPARRADDERGSPLVSFRVHACVRACVRAGAAADVNTTRQQATPETRSREGCERTRLGAELLLF